MTWVDTAARPAGCRVSGAAATCQIRRIDSFARLGANHGGGFRRRSRRQPATVALMDQPVAASQKNSTSAATAAASASTNTHT